MLVSAAITHIRNRTGHDTDQQIVDSTMLLPWIEQETRRVRRELSLKVPALYEQLTGPVNVAAGTSFVTISSGIATSFERLLGVSRRVLGSGGSASSAGDEWVDVPVWEEDSPWLGYREEWAVIRFYPPDIAPGDYRFRWIQGITTAAFTTSTDLNVISGTAGGLPQGFEEIVIELVCATVANRVPGDDPTPHLQAVWGNPATGDEGMWKREVRALRQRYGRSIKPGFRRVRRFA
jgi:hypothetical protein